MPITALSVHLPAFTLGFKGDKGGLGLGLSRPADQNFYVGLEKEDGVYEALPFFENAEDETLNYVVEEQHTQIAEDNKKETIIKAFKTVNREYDLCTDTFYRK